MPDDLQRGGRHRQHAVMCLLVLGLSGCRSHLALMGPPPAPKATISPTSGPPAQALYHYVLSQRYRLDGDLPAAHRSLQLALLFDPESPYLYRALGELAWQQGDPEAAEAALRKALVRTSDPEIATLLGQLRLSRGDPSGAEVLFSQALASQSEPQAWRGLVESRLLAGRLTAAQQALEAWRQQPMDLVDGAAVRARLALRAGVPCTAQQDLFPWLEVVGASGEGLDIYLTATRGCSHYATALDHLERLTRSEPNNPDLHFRLASLASELGDPHRALPAWQQLNRLEGGRDPGVLLRLAAAQSATGAARDALTTLARAEALQPEVPELRLERARALYLDGDLSAALAQLETPPGTAITQPEVRLHAALLQADARPLQAIQVLEAGLERLGPMTGLCRDLALLLARQGELERASNLLQGLASLGPARRAVEQGRLLLEAEDAEAALAWLRDATEKLPADVLLPVESGRILLLAQRPQEAAVLLEATARKFPTEPAVFQMLGMVLGERGDDLAAVSAYRQALQLDPDSASLMNDLAYLLTEGDAAKEALPLATEAVERRPAEPAFLDTLGWVHFRLGFPQTAIPILEAAVRLAPSQPVLRDHLVQAYNQAGRPSDAVALRAGTRFPPLYDGRTIH